MKQAEFGAVLQNAAFGLIVGMCLLVTSAQAEARDVSCGEVKAAVAQMPEVKGLDQEAGWFAYRPGGSINVVCPEAGGAVDLTGGFDPLPGPEDWPFFGRLAQAVGVDPGQAIKAAQECQRTAEARLGSESTGTFTGDTIRTNALHVACQASKGFLSLSVFGPGNGW